MLRRQEEERKRIPKAPMFNLLPARAGGYFEGDEYESIVIDTGMATVKVKECFNHFKVTIHTVCTTNMYDTFMRSRFNTVSVACRLAWLVKMLLRPFSQRWLEGQDTR